MRLLLGLLAGALAAQTLVVDRPPAGPPQPVRIVRGRQSVAEAFRFGAAGEVWMIDRIRVWAMPASGAACGNELGDSIEKITLLGALDNPPVPGQPVCDCHALVPLAAAVFAKGPSAPAAPGVTVVRRGAAWELDFANVRWSLPADADALFTVRATPRAGTACPVERGWSLAAAPDADHALHLLNGQGAPIGLESPAGGRSIRVQVWARPLK